MLICVVVVVVQTHDKVVMRAIRKVAATQRAVICTIHQPSTYLFEMFDALLLLKKGGQSVFFGPLGDNSSKLISYLQVTRVTGFVFCLSFLLIVVYS